jgi:hypothetical protein
MSDPSGLPRPSARWLDRRGASILLLVAVLAVGLVAGWLRYLAPRHAPEGVAMTDLRGVADLRARFNADRGSTRLVVIFSPT